MPPKRFQKRAADVAAAEQIDHDSTSITECNDYLSPDFTQLPKKRVCDGIFQEDLQKQDTGKKKLVDLMAERRSEGLDTEISTNNVGFKLLAKMGFKGDGGLGRHGSGMSTPLAVTVARGRQGLGAAEEVQRKEEEEVDAALRQSEQLKASWDAFQHDKSKVKRVKRAAIKAASVVRNLDERAERERSELWPPLSHAEIAETNKDTSSATRREFEDSAGTVYSTDVISDEANPSDILKSASEEDMANGRWEWDSLDGRQLASRLERCVQHLREVHEYSLLWCCPLLELSEDQFPASVREEVFLVLEEE